MAAKRKTKKTSKRAVKKTAEKTSNEIQVNSLKSEKGAKMPRTRLLILLLLLVVAGTLLYLGKSLFVVALVGGRPISRLTLVKELEKQGGKQALEDLITKELIAQKARKESINISDAEIKSEIDRLSGLVASQGSTLDAALAMQGQTMESLEENIRIQKTIELLLKDSVSVTEEEMKKYFDENKSFYGTDPKFEELKDQISDQLKQQKLQTEFQSFLEKLKSESDVVYFVSY